MAAKSSRKNSIKITSAIKASHIGSCLSVIDILAVLFSMKKNDLERSEETVILSKGHAAAALYSVLDFFDYLDTSLDTYCLDNSLIYGHVNHHASLEIPLSTGSLGHGMPFALGVAIGKRKRNSLGKTYVVMSDGELNEGTTWESALIASHMNLSNLVVIVDRNRIQSLGFTEETLKLEPLVDKWITFGWNVKEIDGHSYDEILSNLDSNDGRPTCLIANTIKGKGVSFMENSIAWHYKSANDSELSQAYSEIDDNFK
jgi:transketolase